MTGDSVGVVNLLAYPTACPGVSLMSLLPQPAIQQRSLPCPHPTSTPHSPLQSERRSYLVHSSVVSSISFTSDDSHVLSSGGTDQTIVQWSVKALGSS